MATQKLKMAKSIKEKVKASSKIILGKWLDNQQLHIKDSSNKLLTIISIPFAYAVYLKKYRNLGEKNNESRNSNINRK